MMEYILERLVQYGLLKKDEKVSINAILGRGANMNVQVFPQKTEKFYNVRISGANLEQEYKGLVRAKSVLGDHVPSPIAWFRKENTNFIVSSGLKGLPISRVENSLIDFIHFYLTRTGEGFLEEGPGVGMCHREFLVRVSQSKEGCRYFSELYHWLECERSSFIDSLPYVAQHGDFVLTNIRIRSAQGRNKFIGENQGRKYFVLDWEDFGRVRLPGFDVIVFSMVLLELSAFWINIALSDIWNRKDCSETGIREIACRIQSSFSLSERQFRDLIKVYMIVFLHLKRSLGYSHRIIQQVEGFISGLPRLGKF